ncbi:unnamed protein product [Cyclocybe aegerita]|uniref:HAT C-terminal dimerisation domain-containing protein n=1 Tax=Cyclocybe aegerita TaxID=1973307 RepID=A0A8S0Y0N7_CYCAE|nr:unnamed protein product [Cyclocybe aegerita]
MMGLKRNREREPFTLEGFLDRLAKWVVVDDQSLDVVDCPELRDLLLYIGVELSDDDIPHRTKLSEIITTNFKQEYMAMLLDIENSLGCVSFTSDIWSRQNQEGYMGVTVHYLARCPATGRLVLRCHLVAFRRIRGSHTGVNIGHVFMQVLKEIRCVEKISAITLNNAGNNNTMMEQLSDELELLGIPFDKDGNRIRCFPHVINLAVKAGLKELTELPLFDQDILDLEASAQSTPSFSSDPLQNNPEYRDALESDVVASVRKWVTACRSSGQRREEFEETLHKLKTIDATMKKLRLVGLLKDMDIHWSSTFRMIDRFLETHPVSKEMIKNNPDLSQYEFTEMEISVLADIRYFLYVFHVVQELVSGEKTPTLSLVLPMYEKLLVMLKDLRLQIPELSHAISVSSTKLEEYLNLSRRTRIYVLAMVINPTIKFKWLEENWDADAYSNARMTVFNVLLEYQQDIRKQTKNSQRTESDTPPSPPTDSQSPPPISRRLVSLPTASDAARAQASGFERLDELARTLSASSIPAASTSGTNGSSSAANEDEATIWQHEDLEDQRIVEAAIRAYEQEGVISKGHPKMKDFDLLRFWQAEQGNHALFWRVACDVLPAQASAVPCERVFSSSKETDTMRRSNLEEFTMEELQILKHRYRNDRINFTEGLVCSERELSVIDMDPNVIDELMAAGKIDELKEYIDVSWEGWGMEEFDYDDDEGNN